MQTEAHQDGADYNRYEIECKTFFENIEYQFSLWIVTSLPRKLTVKPVMKPSSGHRMMTRRTIFNVSRALAAPQTE